MNVPWRVLADLGNSTLKLSAIDAASQAQEFSLHRINLLDHDWPEQIMPSFERFGLLASSPAIWSIASVNRPAYDRLHAWVNRHRRSDRLFVMTHRDLPLQCDVVEVQRVGIDRLIAAWAARELVHQDGVVVVDAGSAMTVDLIDDQGVFRGGAIMAGLRLQIRALATGTDALTEVDLQGPLPSPLAPGRKTHDAIRVGISAAAAGGVRFLVEQYHALVGTPLRLVITGGDAPYLMPHLGSTAVHVPDLILRGLWHLSHRGVDLAGCAESIDVESQ